MTQEWEYLKWNTIVGISDLEANLNLMGSQGWELCHVMNYFLIFATYIFKRPKQ